MAPYFAFGAAFADWLALNGVPRATARRYVGQLLSGLAIPAENDPESDFHQLEASHATAGSFND
jgi:hypothetical protein